MGFAFTEMTLTIPPHRLKQDLGWITKFTKDTNSENEKQKKSWCNQKTSCF
jgi:hypothetical protein